MVKKNKDAARIPSNEAVEAMLASPLIREAWAAAIEAGAAAAAAVLRGRDAAAEATPEVDPAPEKKSRKKRKGGEEILVADAAG